MLWQARCIPSLLCATWAPQGPAYIGKIESIQKDEKDVKKGKTGEDYAIKINTSETNVTFGRQIDGSTVLMSQISRASVDAIKLFKSEMTADDDSVVEEADDHSGRCAEEACTEESRRRRQQGDRRRRVSWR